MPLSNKKVIKSHSAFFQKDQEASLIIDTILEENEEALFESSIETSEDVYSKEEIDEELQKGRKIVEEASIQRDEILAKAHADAEKIRLEAKQSGFEEGKKEGFEAGFSSGLKEGFSKGTEKSEEMKQHAREMIVQAQEEIEDYIQENKESLLSLSVHMAEKIVHEHLALTPDGILELVKPILHQLDREEDFVSLTVHPAFRETLQQQLPELVKLYPGVRFAILSDEDIEIDGCIIESAHKLIDLQVKKQLETILSQLKEMERDV